MYKGTIDVTMSIFVIVLMQIVFWFLQVREMIKFMV